MQAPKGDCQAKYWQQISFVRIAEFSVAVTVVDHVGVRFPQSWGLMEAISEACGISV